MKKVKLIVLLLTTAMFADTQNTNGDYSPNMGQKSSYNVINNKTSKNVKNITTIFN